MNVPSDPALPPATGARPVMLVRLRNGISRQAARSVHLLPCPLRESPAGALSTICGRGLSIEQIETVTPGEGMPCPVCLLAHLCGLPDQPAPSGAGGTPVRRLTAAAGYHSWGWPVTLRRGQIWLHLDGPALGLILPTALAERVIPILVTRRSPAPVLAHPHLPGHRILLGAEPYGLPLPWPPGVHRASGALSLPPTGTPHGPITWTCPPADGHPLHICREIDLFGALHTLGTIGGS